MHSISSLENTFFLLFQGTFFLCHCDPDSEAYREKQSVKMKKEKEYRFFEPRVNAPALTRSKQIAIVIPLHSIQPTPHQREGWQVPRNDRID
jgi:hypothetical protein